MLSGEVLRFVLGELPAPPARVLEVGAGDGALAAALRDAGYDVLAIDPVGEPPVVPVALNDLDEPDGSFDAATAVVSLHHLEPLEESISKLARLVRAGGVLAVDELDVDQLDERATGWWVERIYDLLDGPFDLGPPARGSYLHRWHLDLELRTAEEALIASGELPATGVRFSGRRRERS